MLSPNNMKPMTKAVLRAIKTVASYVGLVVGGISLVVATIWGIAMYPQITIILILIAIFGFFVWTIAKSEYPKILEEEKEAARIQKRKEEKVMRMLNPNKDKGQGNPYC